MLPKGSIGKIFDYYFGNPDYEAEIMRAFQEFFERPDLKRGSDLDYNDKSEGFFSEWFLYDFVFANNKSPLANFIEKNPFKFSSSKLKLYKNILESQVYGMYEILRVDIGYGLQLLNMQNNEQVFVHEKSLTYQMKTGDSFFGRVARVDVHYELIGADSFKLNFSDKDKKIIRQKFSDVKFTPQFANKVWGDRKVHLEWDEIVKNILKNKK